MANSSLDYLNGFNVFGGFDSGALAFDISGVMKLLFFVIVVCYLFYVVLLALRVRILNETVQTPFNRYVAIMSFVHTILAFGGCIITLMIILLA